MFSSESDDGLRFSKSLKWITFGFEVRLVFGPKMTAGRLKLLTLSNSLATVITNFGFESLTCLESSWVVYRGLVVEAIAPIATMERKQIGNWIEFGAKMRTTSLLVMPRLSNPCDTFAIVDFNCEKVMVSEVSASMRAGLFGYEDAFLKRNVTIE